MAGMVEASVASVVEDVLQQNGKRLSDIDLASRKANEAAIRRYEAAGWLRKMVGVVGGKDLPAQPSEEDFRLGLRSGIILCNVLNKVQSGAVSKVVEAPSDAVIVPDGAALSAFQYFENVRNFLVGVEEMGIPTFEASDLAQGGKSSRIVNCVLALKSYSEWKDRGGHGVWKYGGNLKPSPSGKQFVRKNSEPFMNSFAKSLSAEKSLDSLAGEDLGHDLSEMTLIQGCSRPFHNLVHELLSDVKQEEVAIIVENMLSKVAEEFERRLATQNEQIKETMKEDVNCTNEFLPSPGSGEMKNEHTETSKLVKEEFNNVKDIQDEEKDIHDDKIHAHDLKQKMLVEQQHKDLQELKHILSTVRADMQFLQMKHHEEFKCLGEHVHGLAHAASGYQKVLEENRKLYNQVQDLKGSIRVYCRVRPFLPGQAGRLSTVANMEEGKITLITPSKYGKEGRKSFTFNQVFGPSATQEEVFSDMQPLIRSVLDGYNVCIFAYGQTGSGKTYTMSGPSDLTDETLGVNYRALGDLFHISEQRKNIIRYEVFVQMIEIYNEQVRDLLVTDGLQKRLEIRNNSPNGINVPEANFVPVASTSDVIYLMNLGQKNRVVGSTAMNDRSSRSHSCLTVHVQGKNLASGAVIRGCMHLVDLAGSERADKTEAVGDRLKEAQHINKSLSALGDVISSLASRNAHVPYRNSKLTQLLQDSLGGQAKTLMFVHINPESDAIGETISTLKFAERVSTVELGAARTNKDSSADVKELKEQIANLKAALAKKEGESLQQSKLVRMMSVGASTTNPSWQSAGNTPPNIRQPMEDVGNVEVRKNSKPKLRRRQSLDPEDLLNRREAGWVDKVMFDKQNVETQWEEDDRQSSENFCQRYVPNPTKIYPFEQPINKFFGNKNESPDHDMNRSRSETATTDESDDLDAATSESSEPDFVWQQATSIPSLTGSKLKKPSPTHAKSPEIRSSIPQPSSRRLSNGAASPIQKTGRRPVSGDGKRKTGSGK